MIDNKILSKILRDVSKTGKYLIGYRTVSKSLSGSKLVIYSSSLSPELIHSMEESCGSSSIPNFEFEGNSLALGKLFGKQFRISAISIKNPGDVDLTPLFDEIKNETPN